jgi:DNA-binding beta-propeller fold protein YncE
MKKRFTVSILMVLFLGTVALSQQSNWRFSKVFLNAAIHGIAITPDNCIWVNLIGGCYEMPEVPRESDLVLYPDGSVKAVFPNVAADGAGRGISLGHDGKVYTAHGPALYVWDYETMEIVRRIVPKPGVNLTTPVADQFGNILVSFVYCNDNGVMGFNNEGNLYGLAINAGNTNLPGLAREIAVSADGNDLYIATLSGGYGVGHWHSDDGAWGGSYSFVEFIGGNKYSGIGQVVEFDQQGRLWIGADGVMEPSRYDCWDLEKMEIVDCIVSIDGPPEDDGLFMVNEWVPTEYWTQGAFVTPRGIFINNDGTKAYVVDCNNGVLEYEYVGPSDAKEPHAIPEGFALSQNYPNPFNPSTNFTYSLPNRADVRIAVYDLFGREIKTLINESKEAGTYNIAWNGKDNQNRQVATGVYFYKMQAASFEKTMKMMLMK